MDRKPDKDGPILQVALAEFSALRSEIKDRSSAAWTLVNLNITATVAVLGFVLSNKADPKLLLALPLVAPALGLLFIDHAYNIRNLGTYIDKRLRPLVVNIAGPEQLLGYEAAMDEYEERRFLRLIPFGLPLTLLFSGLPLAALIFVIPSLDAVWAWIVWLTGLALVLTQLSLWFLLIVKPSLLDPFKNE